MKQFLALKASAGSGKTFALTVRYICLLLHGARPNEILTLTFTNKAANEMSERIYKTLLTLGDDDAYLQAIVAQSGLHQEEIIGQKPALLKGFIQSEISIYTIDKFVNKILREFCGYLNINDDFEIKEDDVEHLSYTFLESLQLHEFEKLIQFSFHESKKFNSIFDLFKILLEKNDTIDSVNIDNSLIALQKNEVLKYAYKLKEHILNCEGASKSAQNAVNFDSFEGLIKRGKTWLAKETTLDSRDFKKCSNEIFEANFQNLKTELSSYYKLRSAYSLSSLYELYQYFKEYKNTYNKNRNYLEFNDVSNLVYELLNTKIDKDFLYFRLDSKYNHILMDEFQDTSILQFKILQPLIEEIISGSSNEYKTFFYVGDTKQSIYRFRGGKRELFDYVSKTYPQIQTEVLNTNYRSCKNLVEYVNEQFISLPSYEYHAQHSIHKEGYVHVLTDDALEEEEKFKNIASHLAQLFKAGLNANNIAILTYTNDDVLALYSYLSQKFPKLKISTEMTSRLIHQENVKALINAVKYLYYKEDIYKENCNAILGMAPLSQFVLQYDLSKVDVTHLLYDIAQKLKLLDDNVIGFIEMCMKYKNVVDFVYEVDKLETPMQNKEQSGLQILTIFKSKGLEFDTVLLLDRIKRKNVDRSSLLFEYEEVHLKNVFYKVASLEHFDEHYAKALEKEKKLSLDDEINILYVAMTRAKSNLLIFKKQKNSVFDRLALHDCQIGNLIISGDIKNEIEQVRKVQYTPLDLGRQDTQISKESSDKNYTVHAKYFGIATHFCLEMMNTFDKKALMQALNLAKSRFGSFLHSRDFEDIQQRIELLLNNAQFRSLVQNSECITEQALMYKNEVKIIDLLLKQGNTYIIVDYKTTKDMQEEHITQVKHYKKAIGSIFESSMVEGYLVYLKNSGVTIKNIE
jgi:exodeoxyribonuclease V beta subunit